VIDVKQSDLKLTWKWSGVKAEGRGAAIPNFLGLRNDAARRWGLGHEVEELVRRVVGPVRRNRATAFEDGAPGEEVLAHGAKIPRAQAEYRVDEKRE